MKKTILICFVFLLAFPISAFAVDITVTNYFYVHKNAPGTYYMSMSGGATVLWGDSPEHDAIIKSITLDSQGFTSDTLTIVYGDGTTEDISPNGTFNLTKTTYSISLKLIKTDTNETYIKLTQMVTDDPDSPTEYIYYNFTGQTPTNFGSLPQPTPAPTPTPTTTATPAPTPTPTPTPGATEVPQVTPTPEPTPTPPSGNYGPEDIHVNYNASQDILDFDLIDLWTKLDALDPDVAGKYYLNGYFQGYSYDNGNYDKIYDPQEGEDYELCIEPINTDLNLSTVCKSVHFDGQNVTENTGGGDDGGGTGGTTCNGSCQQLAAMLQCPEWDTYMGDLTDAIKEALPPPPNWDEIADKIGAATVNHLSDYLGPVPEPPSQAEIDSQLNTDLPAVDATAADADKLTPEVPAGYEQPKTFDITSGPQIDVTDNSQAFEIFQPLNNLQYNEPGVAVKPGDPSNNTGDITKPGTIPGTVPKPTSQPSMPSNSVPIPNSTTGPGAIPSGSGSSGGTAPQPNATTGPGPKPTWKGE